MGDVVPFQRVKKPANTSANTLCRNGHHRWAVVSERRFDVKQGRLVTLYRCTKCGKERVVAL